jgi:hypothetical protein
LIGSGSRVVAAQEPSTAAPVIVTVADVQRLFDAGDDRGTLRLAAEALSSRAVMPLPERERYTVLVLRGQSLLRLNERAYAIDAFEAASRSAGRGNMKGAAIAKAYAVLVARSQGSAYKPMHVSSNAESIDIVSPRSRAKALAAAFEDLMLENQLAIKAALEGRELPPMLDLVPTLGDLYVLEWAASGEPARTSAVLKSFGLRARLLMGTELARLGKRVESLSELANSWVGSDTGYGSRVDRRGLWTRERDELTEMIHYTGEIRRAAQRARQISLSFGFTGENWDPVIADASALLDRIDELWTRRH